MRAEPALIRVMERGRVGVPPTSGQRRGTVGKERGAGTVGRGSQEGESEIGDILTGALGLHTRYAYTGKRSERSLYIAERAQSMHNLTRDEMLQSSYEDRREYVCLIKRGTYGAMLPMVLAPLVPS